MTAEPPNGNAPTYRIGAVSRLTGVPVETLRVWERRYTVVTPVRSDSGTRLYGPQDLARLAVIKRLVDRGDAIGVVAGLSLEQLRERFDGANLPETQRAGERLCRIAVLGIALGERLRLEEAALDGLEPIGVFDSPEALLAGTRAHTPDLLLLDYPTVHADQVQDLARVLAQSGAARALLVYRFAGRGTLERLEARGILAKRAPVEPLELRRWCLALQRKQSGQLPMQPMSLLSCTEDLAPPAPARRFADRELARIAAASPALRCECPHHLADLVSALTAFEGYCDECESRHSGDAALHAFLRGSTAQARALMESALARLLEVEGIDPGGDVSRGTHSGAD